MDEGLTTIARAGASGSLRADFQAVGEACTTSGGTKYAPAPVMAWLAKVVVGLGGKAHKDMPLFELCHLVRAINGLDDGSSAAERRMQFFFGPEPGMPAAYRDKVVELSAMSNGDHEGIQVSEIGLDIDYPDGKFSVRFARMPFLSALFEFLSGMDEFSFYDEFNRQLDELAEFQGTKDTITFRQVQDTSNKISSALFQYRRKNLPRAQHDEKFGQVFTFLRNRGSEEQFEVDDTTILQFWQTHSVSDDFRLYRTVFDVFVTFMKSLEIARAAEDIEHAAVIGTDRENFEIELTDDEAQDYSIYGDWESPLNLLDEEPASRIKFLKNKNERKPLEQLMMYGPYARRLPLAFLRLESFGPVQAGITSDLQFKRGSKSVQNRLECLDAEPYAQKIEKFQELLAHAGQLQKATFYALQQGQVTPANDQSAESDSNIIDLFNDPNQSAFDVARSSDLAAELSTEASVEITVDAERAFRSMMRKGFDEEFLSDDENLQGFRIAAGALIEVSAQMEMFLGSVPRMNDGDTGIDGLFSDDRVIFSEQFHAIYGDS